MCGIIGILGRHQSAPIMVEALRRLEYRGYDSAGIATVDDGRLERRRAVGKLDELADLLVTDPIRGFAGIGHTRWATHGAPNRTNAHPHQAGPVAVVHNGIVENFRELRAELTQAGVNLETDTDTEVVAQLAARNIRDGHGPVEAAFAAVDRLEGAFALAFLFEGEEDLIVVARQGSPLAIGHGNGEVFVGSDAIALAPLTTTLTYLEEGDRAVLRRGSVEIFDGSSNPVERPSTVVPADQARVDKAGHRHFMAKEIAEQPAVIGDALRSHVRGSQIALPDGVDFDDVERVTLVACGTAHYACHVARYWFEEIAGLPVDIDVASEFRYRNPPVPDGTLAAFVSQSGETADTLAALRYMKENGAKTVGIVNVESSTIAREADICLPIHAGTEIGVASTKAFTCQLLALYVMALKAGVERGQLSDDALSDALTELTRLPGLVNAAIEAAGPTEDLARPLSEARDILFLGRGRMYPLALEGALKLKEISYIHAEGYAAGELKHGPIALIDDAVPVIVFAPSDTLFDKTVSNMQEVMARDGKVLLVSDAAGIERGGPSVWRSLQMPEVPEALAPIVYAVPAQLLAYHVAVAKGTDVDQPRNLAKSVTVE